MHSIVVGIDGSPASLEALRFAIAEARLRGSEVKAVTAWHVPAIVYEGAWTAAPVDMSVYSKDAEATLRATIDHVLGTDPDVPITAIMRHGQPADILCELAADADLMVVGSRGLGGFRGLLLGSVSQQCAHHAPCPVVIIPRDREDVAEATA